MAEGTAEFARELEPVSLEARMRSAYLDYAMSVIVGRALARCSRRTQARASADAVCNARGRQRL